jgi:hypothetical protein
VNIKIIAMVLLIVIASATTPLATIPETQILFNSWLGNEPKMLIKLSIGLPNVNADLCFVIVRRFPTPYNPTKDGLTELIYQGIHEPGTTIEVKNMLFAYVARYKYDEETGKSLVDYYEPQEYVIMVVCGKDDNTVFKWGRIVEVYPKSIIHTETIEIGEKENQFNTLEQATTQNYWEANSGASNNPFTCNVQITQWINYTPGYKKVGECYAWVKGSRIYSIDGLQVSFKIYGGSIPSAVYIEKFYDFNYATYYYWLRPENQVQWKSSGKKLTPSFITGQTSYLAGSYSDQVYFQVRYVYEHYRGCVTVAGCYAYWLLYPKEIGSVARSGEGPPLPYDVRPYTPPSPPNYAYLGFPGTVEIYFADYGEVREYDQSIASITIAFTYAGVWTASLTVNFYKSVRCDNQYTTPTVIINSTRNYWRWFRDNDKTTYEVLVAPR